MKRTGIRKLALKRETVRRLAAGDLARVAGGLLTCCTYGYSGCKAGPTDGCGTDCCDSGGCTDDYSMKCL